MTHITIEMDQRVMQRTCSRCGVQYPSIHGFLYRDGDAWAVYWVDLYNDHPGHPEPRAVLTVAAGDDWSEGDDSSDHAWVQIEAWPQDDDIHMRFIDPLATLDARAFGTPLGRMAALAHPKKAEFLACADEIVYQDIRVGEVLGIRR